MVTDLRCFINNNNTLHIIIIIIPVAEPLNADTPCEVFKCIFKVLIVIKYNICTSCIDICYLTTYNCLFSNDISDDDDESSDSLVEDNNE